MRSRIESRRFSISFENGAKRIDEPSEMKVKDGKNCHKKRENEMGERERKRKEGREREKGRGEEGARRGGRGVSGDRECKKEKKKKVTLGVLEHVFGRRAHALLDTRMKRVAVLRGVELVRLGVERREFHTKIKLVENLQNKINENENSGGKF